MKKTKVRALFLAIVMIVLALGTTLSVEAAPKKKAAAAKVDATLAPPAIFLQSQYALLNPAVAASCKNDVNAMYQYYMSTGVRKGERLYATPLPMPVERLFLYMSYNRATYLANGLNPTFQYFNINNYIAQNPGLVNAYGMNLPMYLLHYLNYGVYEGKSSGTYYDPAKVVLWNSAVAELNNAKMNPAKILANYTAFTGQPTTAAISNPVATTPAPAPAPVYTSSSKHEHDWKYESIDDKKHWKECRNCDEKYKEDHHYHVYSQTNGCDTSRHVLKCSKCDHKYAELHYDRNGDGKCNECGYVMSGHIHHYIPQTTGQTATQHVSRCACSATIMENHDWQYVYNGGNTQTHTKSCRLCGYVASTGEACDMAGTGSSCSKCGHLNGVIPSHTTHTWGTYTSNNNGTHTAHCTFTGCTATNTVACDHNGTGGKCSVCDYEWPAPAHTHTYGAWTDNNNGTHTRTCTAADCPGGDDASQIESCSPNGPGDTCSTCGHTFPPAAHSHTYDNSWTSDSNGKHYRYCNDGSCPDHDGSKQEESCDTAGSNGTCSVCGYDPSNP